MLNFRNRTDFSLLYATTTIDDIIEKAQADENKAAIITEKEGLLSAIEFYKTAKNKKLNPILSLEVDLHLHKNIGEKKVDSFPIIAVAKNADGYLELMELSSLSYTYGLYKKPRINLTTLENCKNIYVIDPSNDGFIWSKINSDAKSAYDYAVKMQSIFGTDFIVGISIENKQTASLIFDFANKQGIRTVPTIETLYAHQENAAARLNYLLIGKSEELTPSTKDKYFLENRHLRSDEEIEAEFVDFASTLSTAKEIIEGINLNIKIGDPTPPKFKFYKEYALNEGFGDITEAEYFAKKCWEGFDKRSHLFPEDILDVYKSRLTFEINVISNMKFPGYMLIVWDFIREAKKLGIPVGPGRGSAAGSLVAYCLEITNIDPIKNKLLFERFLNPERVSMPDIDIDFCTERREEVINYVISKYGFKSVAQIATFSTLLPKGVIKDVGKVLGVLYNETDAITKKLPATLESLSEIITDFPELMDEFSASESKEQLLNCSIQLEGLKRNIGVHAAGVVICDEEVWKKAPVRRDQNSKSLITQYSLEYMEDVDLIKFDFLGLKTLTVIDMALKSIKRLHGVDVDFETMEMDDPAVYEFISTGYTIGIFQIESPGMQGLCKAIQPDSFEDLTAILALYRPGPMNSGMLDDFIERKHGRAPIIYSFDSLSEILGPTYGVPVYQEQIMSIVQTIGNFSLGNADVVRRAMGKKKPELMQKYKQEFIDGGVSLGYDEKKVGDLFDQIAGFAEYGFNKSHSAAYAMISYQTAWLKTYYPAEFMAAVMTYSNEDSDKLSNIINESKRLDIKMLPPCVNESGKVFLPTKDKEIRFGLSMIKGFGDIAAEDIIQTRLRNGKFKSIQSFLLSSSSQVLKKDSLEALAASGSLDIFGFSRCRLFELTDYIISWTSKIKALKTSYARSIFSSNKNLIDMSFELPYRQEWNEMRRYSEEVVANSVAIVASNPVTMLLEQSNINHEPEEYEGTMSATDYVIITSIKQKISKKGSVFYIAQLLNKNTAFEALMFSDAGDYYKNLNPEEKKSLFKCEVKSKINDAGFKNVSISKLVKIDTAFGRTKEVKTGEMAILLISEINKDDVISNAEKIINGYKKLILIVRSISGKAKVLDTDIMVDDNFLNQHIQSVDMSLKWKAISALSKIIQE